MNGWWRYAALGFFGLIWFVWFFPNERKKTVQSNIPIRSNVMNEAQAEHPWADKSRADGGKTDSKPTETRNFSIWLKNSRSFQFLKELGMQYSCDLFGIIIIMYLNLLTG